MYPVKYLFDIYFHFLGNFFNVCKPLDIFLFADPKLVNLVRGETHILNVSAKIVCDQAIEKMEAAGSNITVTRSGPIIGEQAKNSIYILKNRLMKNWVEVRQSLHSIKQK